MAQRKYNGDLAVFSVASSSLLDSIPNVTFEVNIATAEGKPVSRIGQSPNVVGKGGKITTEAMSNVTGIQRVTNLQLSALSIGGNDVVAFFDGLTFNGSFTTKEGKARKDIWGANEVVGKAYTGTIDLMIPTAGFTALEAIAFDNSSTTAYITLTFTLNGVAITLPVVLTNYRHVVQVEDLQKISCDWTARDPLSGNFPTAPTGTTSLLEKAFNDPRTAIAYSFQAYSGAGTISGTMVWDSFGFSITSDDVVKTQYAWTVLGTPTYTP